MQLSLNQLNFTTIPGRHPDLACLETHQSAYRLWKQVWSDTLMELDHNGMVYADDFTRQEIICTLSAETRCVALAFMSPFDFSRDAVRDDSYFKVWSEPAIRKLVADGPRIVIGSNITVDKEYRGDLGNGVLLKNLILGLVTRTMLDLDVDAMTGTMRNNRGMNQSAFRFGAEPLETGVIHHGVPVDLVAFYRRRILASAQLTNDLSIESLYRRMTRFDRVPRIQGTTRKAA